MFSPLKNKRVDSVNILFDVLVAKRKKGSPAFSSCVHEMLDANLIWENK